MKNKRLFFALTFCFAWTIGVDAQTERSLSIEEMFQLIDEHNHSVQVSKTAILSAEEAVRAAKNQQLPDIKLQVNASYIGNALMTDRDFGHVQNLTSPHFGNQFLVDVQQVIYAGGAISAGIQLAQLGASQAQLEYAQNKQNQRFIVLGQYLDLQKIAHRKEVVENNIELTEKLIRNISEKQQQGLALKNDITRYELQLETQKLTLTQLQNTRKILNHQLCNSLGLSTSETIIPTDDATKTLFDQDDEQQWQKMATGNNLQLQMAGVGEQMAHEKVKLSKSELLPKIAIVAQNNFNGPITFELPPIDKNLNVWFVGVGVQYQLSSLFKSKRKLAQARMDSRMATEQKTVVAEQLNNQVQAAYVNYMQSYVELETQQKSVQLALQNYQVVNNRYLNQLALVTDMIDASNMKLDAELKEVDARINIAYAYYKMKYIVGQL